MGEKVGAARDCRRIGREAGSGVEVMRGLETEVWLARVVWLAWLVEVLWSEVECEGSVGAKVGFEGRASGRGCAG